MSPMLVVILVSAAVIIFVLIGSLYVISKGYGYTQKIDPHPDEEEHKEDGRKE